LLNLLDALVIGPLFNRGEGAAGWWFGSGLIEVLVLVALLRWGHAMSLASLKALVAANVVAILGAVAAAPTPLGMLSAALSLVVAVLYVAYWFPRWRDVTIVVAGTSFGFLAVIVHQGQQGVMLFPWYYLSIMSGTIAVGLHALRRSYDRMATHDPMTGFLNRHGLAEFLSLGARAGRTVLPRSIVVVDLDDLKLLNDREGHAAGDAALLDFAEAGARLARQDDIMARLGGDEFAFVLMKANLDGANAFLDRLRDETVVNWSAGIADWPADADFFHCLTQADRAMYEDKRSRKSA
jgi:diguanylate cyclase (GGDEF)-like protein